MVEGRGRKGVEGGEVEEKGSGITPDCVHVMSVKP